MDFRRRVRSGPFGRASLSVRIASFATVLALCAFCVLGYVQIRSLSGELTHAAEEQGITGATSTARAIAGLSPSVVSIIPSSPRGVDGVVVFDRDGHVLAGSGGTQTTLGGLGATARGVARSGKAVLEFRVPQGGARSRRVAGLTPWSSSRTLQITVLPKDGGAVALGSHMGWATDRLRSTAISSALNLGGGVAFLCFALMLLLGRLVTRPLGRLAAEV